MTTTAGLAAAARSPDSRADPACAAPGWHGLARHECRALVMTGLRIFSFALLAWQAALMIALVYGLVDLAGFARVHIIGCLGLAIWPLWRWKRAPADSRYMTALQIVAWSALAGPFGAFVAIALLLPPTRGSSQAWDSGIETPAIRCAERSAGARMHRAVVDGRLRIEGASRVRPLIDLIAEGSRSEKLDALALVYRKYEAKLGAVLKSALRDPDPSVRVLAATVTAKLNANYARKIGGCQRAALAAPEVAQNWRDVAGARMAYAESGLLEPPRARAYLDSAMGDLARAVELDPSDRGSYELLDRTRRKLAARTHDERRLRV